MQSFRVICVTCNASLRVRDASLIGHILPCPKCNSMVEVIAPDTSETEEAPTEEVSSERLPEQPQQVEEQPPAVAAASLAAPIPVAGEPIPIGEFPTLPQPAWPKWVAIGSAGAVAAAILVGSFFLVGGDSDTTIESRSNTVALADTDSDAERSVSKPKDEADNTAAAKVTADKQATDTAKDEGPNSSDTQTSDAAKTASDFDPFATEALKANSQKGGQTTPATDDDAATQRPTETAAKAANTPRDNNPTESESAPRSKTPVASAPKVSEPRLAAAPTPAQTQSSSKQTEPTTAAKQDPASPANAAKPAAERSTVAANVGLDNNQEIAQKTKPAQPPIPPADIDVTARLSIKMASATFPKVPFPNFITTLSSMSAVPIHYDSATLARVGRSSHDLVKLSMQDASLGQTLDKALGKWGLSYLATGPRVIVRVPPHEKATLKTVRHEVADLARSQASLDRLAVDVQALIAPHSWKTNADSEGRGSIQATGGVLKVEQSMDVQFQILVLREKLRIARGLELKSRLAPLHFQLKTRQALGKEMLKKSVTLRPAEGETLATIAKRLSHATGLSVAVDEIALLEAGRTSDEPVTVEIDKEPLAVALDALVQPHNLAYRIVNQRLIEITTPTAAAEAYHIEFYPVRKLASDRDRAALLIDRIQQQVRPQGWRASGGTAAIVFDESSRALIVRQTAAGHADLAAFLQE